MSQKSQRCLGYGQHKFLQASQDDAQPLTDTVGAARSCQPQKICPLRKICRRHHPSFQQVLQSGVPKPYSCDP
ncbi:hypothetical protein AYI69_g3159 [Smittium culicis]|uniref:Uncharacterized protein n=1 Tax=Smittium culicis TaxID=133412 RepID=A0A1R1YKH7_9FUNG|nr:hypothetical protein AYI69_g3159 [Smittium culicis]